MLKGEERESLVVLFFSRVFLITLMRSCGQDGNKDEGNNSQIPGLSLGSFCSLLDNSSIVG